MIEGIFEINSYEIDDLLGYIRGTSHDVEETNDEAKTDFECYKRSEVFGKGAQTINDQMDVIFEKLDSLGNVMQNGTSKIFETEMKILQEARDLEIPTGYETKETMTDKSASGVGLEKNDGTSVNEGKASEEIKVEINSEIEEEKLKDIRSEETERQELEERTFKGEEVGLRDITQEETQEQRMEDNYTDNRQEIAAMEEKEAQREVEVKEIEGNKVELGEVGEGTRATEVEFEMEPEIGRIG